METDTYRDKKYPGKLIREYPGGHREFIGLDADGCSGLMKPPQVWIVAGPNGSGKTSLVAKYIANFYKWPFCNWEMRVSAPDCHCLRYDLLRYDQ